MCTAADNIKLSLLVVEVDSQAAGHAVAMVGAATARLAAWRARRGSSLAGQCHCHCRGRLDDTMSTTYRQRRKHFYLSLHLYVSPVFGTVVLTKSKCIKSAIPIQMLRQSGATRPVIMSFCPCATRKPLGTFIMTATSGIVIILPLSYPYKPPYRLIRTCQPRERTR